MPLLQEMEMSVEEIVIDDKIKLDIRPDKYNVVVLNDNMTPMEWVVSVLEQIFKHSNKTANDIMLKVHNEGSAVVGTYSYEIAEQKAGEATTVSRQQGFPLTFKLDKE